MRRRKLKDAFEAIQEEWYSRLAADGFQDIENTCDPRRPLKSWHSFRFGRRANHTKHAYDPDALFISQEYYRKVEHYIEATYGQEQSLERRMLELHAKGLGVRKIGAELGMHYLQVHKFIRSVKPKIRRQE